MATVTRTMNVPIDDVYAALAEPRTYPEWLVGAKEIRSVDAGWPERGTKFHHRVGLIGPLTIADSPESLGVEPGRRLTLEARARPAGRAKVDFELVADGNRTVVTMHEHPLGILAPAGPLLDPATALRNKKSLRQLEDHLRSKPTTTKRASVGASRARGNRTS
jgi:uncharacterized protein YndB with AHSA1/START domain